MMIRPDFKIHLFERLKCFTMGCGSSVSSGNADWDSYSIPPAKGRRVRRNVRVLFHVTSAESARKIAEGGFMLRGSAHCMFGSGIYFAEKPEDANRKAWHGSVNEGLIEAEVDLGNSFLVPSKSSPEWRSNNIWNFVDGPVPSQTRKQQTHGNTK